MCDIRKYPDHYSKADWILRVMKINQETAGYELLRRAIVVWEVEKTEITEKALQGTKSLSEKEKNAKIEEELVNRVRKMADMQICKNRLIKNDRCAESQAMIESIRASSENGVKISILDFVNEITENIF